MSSLTSAERNIYHTRMSKYVNFSTTCGVYWGKDVMSSYIRLYTRAVLSLLSYNNLIFALPSLVIKYATFTPVNEGPPMCPLCASPVVGII